MTTPGDLPHPELVALDTSAAIDLLRSGSLPERLSSEATRLALPAPVISELIFGDLKSPQHGRISDELGRLLGAAATTDITADVARSYAELRPGLERAGRKIPMNDVWIAACCVSAGVPLLTRDAHFAAVAGLDVIMR